MDNHQIPEPQLTPDNISEPTRYRRRKNISLNPVALAIYYVVAVVVALTISITATPHVTLAAGNLVTGTVYSDYNENGILDTAITNYTEPGVAGVTVRAYAAGSTTPVATGTTSATGTYSLDVGTNTAVRIEFDSTTFPTGAQPSMHGIGTGGTSDGTTVQFVTAPTTQIDLGINVPSDFCKSTTAAKPGELITPCYFMGPPASANVTNKAAILAVPVNTANGGAETANTTLATIGQVGTVWGVAYQRGSDTLFASAFQKRHAGFGTYGGSLANGTTGGIYKTINVQNGTPTTTPFLDLNTAAILGVNSTGANPHPNTTATFSTDVNSFAAATKVGLGGLTISDDGLTMYTVNLATQQLVIIPLGTNPASPVAPTSAAALNTAPTTTQVGHYSIPGTVAAGLPGATNTCNATGDVRPFGVSYHLGKLYIGIVCSAQSTPTNAARLTGYVYTFDPVAYTFSTAPVIEFPLNYNRGSLSVSFNSYPIPATSGNNGNWNPWTDTYTGTTTPNMGDGFIDPQPILSDITFDGATMIIGMRDRLGDQAGPYTPLPIAGDTHQAQGIAGGDILRASANSSVANKWVMENNAQAGTGAVAFGPSTGAGDNKGPGGGEFYYDDGYNLPKAAGTCCHQQVSDGSVIQYPGSTSVAMTQMDVSRTYSGGFGWYNNTVATPIGGRQRIYEIYAPDGGTGYAVGNTFQKSNGLGGVELVCDAAPIELGNRIWKDTNGDGFQDAGEPGIANVTVVLYQGATQVGTTTTNANGDYFFNASNVTGGLLPSTAYQVRIGSTANYTTGGPLAGLQLTKANIAAPTGYTGAIDTTDSDAVPATAGNPLVSGTNLAVINVTTGLAGYNDDTLDAGFTPGVNLGNFVWIDTNNDGVFNGAEVGKVGVVVNLYQDNGGGLATATFVGTATTDASGNYLFSNIPANNNYIVTLASSNFTGAGVLVGYTSSTGGFGNPYEPPAAGGADNTDHGTTTAVAGSGVASASVAVGLTDVLTFDFGLVPQQRIGNYVWIDPNNNGTWDTGEVGINGVKVNLYLAPTGATTLDTAVDALIATTTTANSGTFPGHYSFTSASITNLTAAPNGLVPGTYFVQIDPTNFTGAGALVGYTNSAGQTAANNRDNGAPVTGMGIASAPIVLTAGGAPTGEETGAPTAANPTNDTTYTGAGGDSNSNYTVDFGFYQSVNLGNFVWIDTDNNGTFNGSDVAKAGVVVNLYKDTGSGLAGATFIGTATTDASGNYLFSNIPANTSYFVTLDSSNFTGAGVLVGYTSSTGGPGNPYEPPAAGGADNTDHGTVTAVTGAGVTSASIALGTTDNLTIDFGLTPKVRLGNFVWLDLDNSGTVNNAEATGGINGVAVNLYEDTNKNGVFDSGTDKLIGTTTTASVGGNPGHYIFDSTNVSASLDPNGLLPGTYFVQLDPSNFLSTGALYGTTSSSTAADSFDTAPLSAITGSNNKDHGKYVTGQGIVSSAVVLTGLAAPTDDEGTGQPNDETTFTNGNANSNVSVDLGVTNIMRIGNFVWRDTNNNGILDTGESPIISVKVNLYRDNGNGTFDSTSDTVVATTITDGNGHYYFNNVLPGKYFVQVDPTNFTGAGPLVSYTTSTGQTAANNQDIGANSPVAGQGVVSTLITMVSNAAPTGDENDAMTFQNGDTNSNSSTDFGFVPPATNMRVGNYVWADTNNNGVLDSGEAGIANVVINLYKDNGDGIFNPATDTKVGTTTTSLGGAYGTGHYVFDSTNVASGVVPGTYFVQMDPTNFTGSGALLNQGSSTGSGTGYGSYENLTGSASTSNNIDHGYNTANGVVSRPIVLANGTEPTGDESDASSFAGGDTNSNMTLDFGFTPLYSLGNTVWIDTDNNGSQNGAEVGKAGVAVTLFADTAGTGVYNASDTVVGTTTTNASGVYNFTNLPPGNYIVRIDASNFTGAGALVGYSSSTGGTGSPFETNLPNPASTTDNTDHGKAASDGSVVSNLVQITNANRPEIDFGFNNNQTSLRLGNYVWKDLNNNGSVDSGEPGIPNVKMDLLDNAGNPILNGGVAVTTLTDSTGHYYFAGLAAGTYKVSVDVSNFTGAGALVTYISSATTGAANNVNHGTQATATSAAIGPSITLTIGGATTGDEADATAYAYGDSNSEVTQDFGFHTTAAGLVSLGNYVWTDTNNNGTVDGGETAIPGVKVNLYRDTNGNGVIDAGDTTIGTATTDSNGQYLFTNLTPSTNGTASTYYLVQVDPTNFNSGGALYGKTSSTGTTASGSAVPYEGGLSNPTNIAAGSDNTDHGKTSTAALGVVTNPIILTASSTSVDFGFTPDIRIGNYVWNDSNDNGSVDSNETAISGVKVNLYLDNGDGVFGAGDVLVGTVTTDANGHYVFDNSTVPEGIGPGKYFVQIDPSNFITGGPLVNRSPSSSVGTANNNNDGTASPGNGVLSQLVTVASGTAPTGDESDATSNFVNGDPNSNLSVDFGFVPIPTSIQLAYFLASSNGSGVSIDWTTASEDQNLGFNLYFKPTGGQVVKLNDAVIPSKEITGHRAENYHFDAANLGAGQYFLEEVSLSNKVKEFGPFNLGQSFGATPSSNKPTVTGASQPASAPRATSGQHSFNLQTQAVGTYHLTYEYLTAQGIDFSSVVPARMTLTGPEGAVNLKVVTANPNVFGPGDYIEWQAKAFHNIYTDYNTYVLNTFQVAGQSQPTKFQAASTAPSAATTNAVSRIEQNTFYWEDADSNVDPWFWDYLSTYSSATASKTFNFDLPNLASGGQATSIKVYLRGWGSDIAIHPNHQVHAWLNGTDLGLINFDGTGAAVIRVNGPVALQTSGNSLKLTLATLAGSSHSDIVLFDYIELSYPQSSVPVFSAVQSVRPHLDSPLAAANTVDYLIIANSAFSSGVQPLVDLHTSEGLKVKVVDINAIYDNYSQGIVDANAIKAYIADQQKQSSLKYVLLVGADSYDPMNYYGAAGYGDSSPSFIPSLYALDDYDFRAPSDQLLVGNGSLIAIGRFPVQTTAELSTLVNKTVQLANASKNNQLSKNITFVSDSGNDFNALNDTLASLTTGYNVQKDYLNNGSTDQLHSQLIDQINSGNLLVNYSGHAGTNGWGLSTFWRDSDIKALSNSANPLVVVQWACYNTFYATPYSRSMAEDWLTSTGGAGFVLGATNQSLTSDQTELATRFYQNVLTNHMSLGQALAKAKADMLSANGHLTDISQGFLIMGDPAIKF